MVLGDLIPYILGHIKQHSNNNNTGILYSTLINVRCSKVFYTENRIKVRTEVLLV